MTPPAPIAAYFAARPGDDPASFLASFAEDAVVFDEGARHTGRAAIHAWWLASQAAHRPTTEILATREEPGATIIRAKVSGTFPGSPVELDFRFTLDGAGRIAGLEIH